MPQWLSRVYEFMQELPERQMMSSNLLLMEHLPRWGMQPVITMAMENTRTMVAVMAIVITDCIDYIEKL